MSNNLGITLNKETITRGLEEIQECKKYFNIADENITNGINSFIKTKGSEEVLNIDQSLDISKIEKVLEGCRNDINSLITNIQTNVDLAEEIDKEPSNRYETIQKIRKNLNEEKFSSIDKQLNNIQLRTTEEGNIVDKLEEMDQLSNNPEDIVLNVKPPIDELNMMALDDKQNIVNQQHGQTYPSTNNTTTYTPSTEIEKIIEPQTQNTPQEAPLKFNIPKPRVPNVVVNNSELEKNILKEKTTASVGALAGFAGIIAASTITANTIKNKNDEENDEI